ncbi:site-specific integrase [Sphingobium yanoikuyae]|uniref:Site-specific integrase n=1 Tax=Sphingobium yanoikuyae TaxID=13690 RepID=A0AA42X216_SPHYA|nr:MULTISPECIES: site-specific integrase [Sphingobium]MDH2133999.1 site-specific integrase [Sphingobium yanoikuyae]MDH2152030.1 site-specific integrase [Sphingobium yanoikuyae]MDH2169372.1 site-specific integrase [Sphingobium yanoikuyae]QCB39704.1 site-specific integrase [Sphingobium sp. PAMC28499]
MVANQLTLFPDELPARLNDTDRTAPWLLEPYSAPHWRMASTNKPEDIYDIDFEFIMADGVCLTKHPRLYHAVKEYAFLVRDGRYSKVDNADVHAALVRNVIKIARYLTDLGIYTFAEFTPYLVEKFVEFARYGTEAVLAVPEKIRAYIIRLASEQRERPTDFGGFPVQGQRASEGSPVPKHRTSFLDYDAVGQAIGLPGWILPHCPQARWHLVTAAIDHGVKVSTLPADEMPEIANVTVQNLTSWLDPIEGLYAMADVIGDDAIKRRPFPQGLAEVARTKGVGTVRTPTPPPRLALHLMENAAIWVVEHSDALIKAYERVAVRYRHAPPREGLAVSDVVDDEELPFEISIRQRQRGYSLSLGKAIRYLMTACFIVIATFTARRLEEILDLRVDSLRGNDLDGYFLEIYIEKTLQRKEAIPVPNVVAAAFKVLMKLSARAREAAGNDVIFQYSSIIGQNEKHFSFAAKSALDDFARFVEVPLPKAIGDAVALPWHWSPHQFRRFFAILYYYRWEGASINVLAHHLRHFNLEMTRVYVTKDPDVDAIWTDTEWGFNQAKARAIVSNHGFTGGMGKKLSKYGKLIMDKMRQMVLVIDPKEAGFRLKSFMQRSHLVLTPKPWVDCTCPRSRKAAERARCRAGKALPEGTVGPDFASANPTVCIECPWALISASKLPYYDGQAEELQFAVASAERAGTLFGDLEAANLVILNEVRDARAGKSSEDSILDYVE